jgi:hypothetical protein
MANLRDLEEALARYPEMIEEGLPLIGRQVVVCGRPMDGVWFETGSKGGESRSTPSPPRFSY